MVGRLPKQTGRQSSRATQSTVLEILALPLEEGQQLLEYLIPMPADFALSASLEPGAWLCIVSRSAETFVGSVEVYPAAQGFAVPINGLRATNRQASLRGAPAPCWLAIAPRNRALEQLQWMGTPCRAACPNRHLKLYVERPMRFAGRVPIQSERVSPQRRGVAGVPPPDFGSASDPFIVLSFRPRTSGILHACVRRRWSDCLRVTGVNATAGDSPAAVPYSAWKTGRSI